MSRNTRFCAIFGANIFICAIFYAFSISVRGSHGLSTQRAQRTKSSQPEGPPNKRMGRARVPRLLVLHICLLFYTFRDNYFLFGPLFSSGTFTPGQMHQRCVPLDTPWGISPQSLMHPTIIQLFLLHEHHHYQHNHHFSLSASA